MILSYNQICNQTLSFIEYLWLWLWYTHFKKVKRKYQYLKYQGWYELKKKKSVCKIVDVRKTLLIYDMP